MFHHDTRDYQTAASAAATVARKLMEDKIAAGRASAVSLFNSVEEQAPIDRLARGRALNFEANENGVFVHVKGEENPLTIHNHALNQVAQKAGIPFAYLADLVRSTDPWKNNLATKTLNDFFHNETTVRADDVSNSRHLVRVVKGQVRGFLSDRYRRLDSRPLVHAFAEECQALNAVPVEGVVTDTRIALKAFLPLVFEPVPNEVMCLGIEWGNSDFGAAKHTLRAFIFRLWCSNGATMEDLLAQVHLGGKLSEDVEFSDKTYALDTRTSVSALRDTVRGALGPKSVNTLLETIKSANEKQIEWKNLATKIGKKLLKEELKAARDAFESDDVINLPAVKSVWRASNAISWIAGKTEDQERRLELQKIAGEVIHGKAEAVAA